MLIKIVLLKPDDNKRNYEKKNLQVKNMEEQTAKKNVCILTNDELVIFEYCLLNMVT